MAVWDPFDEVRRLEEAIDSVFSDFWRTEGRRALPTSSKHGKRGELAPTEEIIWSPAVDIIDREKEIVVKADLPGVDKNNIKIKVDPESISISGEIKKEKKEENETYYREERIYGKFSRVIPLPSEVDPEKAEAKFENGVLEITAPKVKPAKKVKEITLK
jgi:HSP20 family protein